MGLIRKSLMLGTVGVVRGSSKKQRVAKAQLKELKEQTRIIQVEARARRAAVRVAPVHSPAAGWYPDQTSPHLLRYFDGQRWTEQVAQRQ